MVRLLAPLLQMENFQWMCTTSCRSGPNSPFPTNQQEVGIGATSDNQSDFAGLASTSGAIQETANLAPTYNPPVKICQTSVPENSSSSVSAFEIAKYALSGNFVKIN